MSESDQTRLEQEAHPLTHRMYQPLSKRVGGLCVIHTIKPKDALFNFKSGTVLEPKVGTNLRVRPLYWGNPRHFIDDLEDESTHVVQVEMQKVDEDEPEVITYVIPPEAPMRIIKGETVFLDKWQELLALAVTDPDEFIELRDMLANIIFEMSDAFASPSTTGIPLEDTSLHEQGKSMFPVEVR